MRRIALIGVAECYTMNEASFIFATNTEGIVSVFRMDALT